MCVFPVWPYSSENGTDIPFLFFKWLWAIMIFEDMQGEWKQKLYVFTSYILASAKNQ